MSGERTQESRSFESSKRKAEDFAKSPEQTSRLADKAREKLDRSKERLREVQGDVSDMIRLVKAWVRGEYTRIPWKAIVAIIAALIYFVNPFDAIPDFLPFFGFPVQPACKLYQTSAERYGHCKKQRIEIWKIKSFAD